MSRIACTCLLLVAATSTAKAISIRRDEVVSSVPFETSYHRDQFPLNLVLQVDNPSTTVESIIAWQLDMELWPVDGADGALLFSGIKAPPDPLFVQDTAPQFIPEVPPASAAVIASDGDTTDPFDGEHVFAGSPRNMVQLTLVATAGAKGAFQLVMRNFDEDTQDGSFWVDSDFSPHAFDNSNSAAVPGFTLLGTINVLFVAGDYDGDGNVTVADYDTWRSQFCLQVGSPGQGADGNQNGFVDAADYVLWRLNLMNAASETLVTERGAAPEPTSLSHAIVLTIGALVIGVGRTTSRGQFARNDSAF